MPGEAVVKDAKRGFLKENISEADFQRQVLDLADLFGWTTYHTYDSRRSRQGFPDLVMVKRGRLIFAEIKSEKGRLSDEQEIWQGKLAEVEFYSRGNVTVRVWRPSDWPRNH